MYVHNTIVLITIYACEVCFTSIYSYYVLQGSGTKYNSYSTFTIFYFWNIIHHTVHLSPNHTYMSSILYIFHLSPIQCAINLYIHSFCCIPMCPPCLMRIHNIMTYSPNIWTYLYRTTCRSWLYLD